MVGQPAEDQSVTIAVHSACQRALRAAGPTEVSVSETEGRDEVIASRVQPNRLKAAVRLQPRLQSD